ncbi:MAG: tetratricopeptide repeat protein [Flavobacteriales bacterium]
MAKKKYNKKAIEESTTKEVFESLDQSAIESQRFLEKNAKLLSIIFGGLLAVVLAYFAYIKLYQEPQNQAATKDLYNAKVELEKDSVNLALNGQSGGYIGLNEIKEKYSHTDAGNLANFYAAVANYKQGEYAKAFDNLNAFEANDEILAAMKIGMQGDCLAQTAEYEKALEYYQNAANARDNEFTTPMYLLKAGKLALILNKKEQALKFFNEVKEKYNESSYATDIDKYIARAK